MPVLISRSSFLFAILFCCIYFIAGKEAPLNWDEEASIDIALGIRPQFMKNPDGSLIKELPYGQILQSSTFTSADYKKFNDAKGVVHATWRDNSNSVLYYLTLHYLMKVSGLNITVLRFLTIFLSGICLLLIFQIAARCSNGSVYIPLLAMVLMGCNPVFFSTAFVIRGYMLCLALLLSATYVWLQIIQSKKYSFGQLSLFGLLCAAAVLTHYFSLAVVSFFFLHLAVTTSRRWMAWLMGLALFMVPLLFWLYISWEEGIKNLMLLDAAWSGASKGKNWEVTGVNYLKQLFNAFTYLTGIDANNPLLPRMVWQGL
ncbi:MAG TPA: hypothetical protein VEB42_07320, partial [Chitinophagaceae bacterium]|nr:hypothetical protein [Chitinophagaceae bacterium]